MEPKYIPSGIILFVLISIGLAVFRGNSRDTPYPKTSLASIDISQISSHTKAKIPSDMLAIQGGSFIMGGETWKAEQNEFPGHEVVISNFLIGKKEVSFCEFDEYCMDERQARPDDLGWGRGDRPVINVSWWDAINYCNWRSKKEGLEAAYIIKRPFLSTNFQANGYRLPTEAEWEYAASVGGKGRAQIFAGSDVLKEVGWYNKNSSKRSQLSGQLMPNEWGLYDMSGNVKEWCYDLYGEFYYISSEYINPKGDRGFATRVVRGGSYLDDESDCRIRGRAYMYPSQQLKILGFRLARSLPKENKE